MTISWSLKRYPIAETLTQTLVKDPAHLDNTNPFSPVMPMNSGSIIAQITFDKPKKKVGAVLKPYEIRAFVELVKLGQANRENLFIVGTDCLGTYENVMEIFAPNPLSNPPVPKQPDEFVESKE